MGEKKLKILVVSNFFAPEITPRAMRTYELVKEFRKEGHEVTVVLPGKNKRDIERVANLEGAEFKFGAQGIGQKKKGNKSLLKKIIPSFIQDIIFYFYNHEYFMKYDRSVFDILKNLKGDYDLLISISYPVAIHRAVRNAFITNPSLNAKVKVAEFSDPPMRGDKHMPVFFPYKRFMSKLGRFFDYFAVPVRNAIPEYRPYIPEDRILIIPQAFDNSDIRIARYEPNDVPTFIFAGRFYRKTRDPEAFLQHLAHTGKDFRFIVYLTDSDPYFISMLERYSQISEGEIIIKKPIDRQTLIYEMSKADFLINHNYTYGEATPSKLIDYSLTGRPVFSFSSNDFDSAALNEFLNGDYTKRTMLPDPGEYDIKKIALKFTGLVEHS